MDKTAAKWCIRNYYYYCYYHIFIRYVAPTPPPVAGRPGCVHGGGEGQGSDGQADHPTEGHTRLALPPQVPQDAEQLHHGSKVHPRISRQEKIRTGRAAAFCRRERDSWYWLGFNFN